VTPSGEKGGMRSRMQSTTTMPPRSTWPMASVYESPPRRSSPVELFVASCELFRIEVLLALLFLLVFVPSKKILQCLGRDG
jgi:hypothetical protein